MDLSINKLVSFIRFIGIKLTQINQFPSFHFDHMVLGDLTEQQAKDVEEYRVTNGLSGVTSPATEDEPTVVMILSPLPQDVLQLSITTSKMLSDIYEIMVTRDPCGTCDNCLYNAAADEVEAKRLASKRGEIDAFIDDFDFDVEPLKTNEPTKTVH